MADKAYSQVIEYLKKGIINKTYGLGEKLPSERELAEQLKVSRNSVREALRVLEIIGVVRTQQGAGNYVSDDFENSIVEMMSMMYALNRIDNEQISEYRHALELRAYLLAMKKITPEEIEKLKYYIKRIDASNSDEEKAQCDKNIHFTIVKASGNWMLVKNIEALNQVIDIFIRDMRWRILQSKEGEKLLQESHWQMVKALETKEETKGVEALNRHFSYIKNEIVENNKRYIDEKEIEITYE
ncbi:MAG: FadR/GntR family transcriptional regulator [Lachnospiraceae bacterium]